MNHIIPTNHEGYGTYPSVSDSEQPLRTYPSEISRELSSVKRIRVICIHEDFSPIFGPSRGFWGVLVSKSLT